LWKLVVLDGNKVSFMGILLRLVVLCGNFIGFLHCEPNEHNLEMKELCLAFEKGLEQH
jgi:hypothetical protein